jgi:hypothetical protein
MATKENDPSVFWLPNIKIVSEASDACAWLKSDHYASESFYTYLDKVTKGSLAALGGMFSYPLLTSAFPQLLKAHGIVRVSVPVLFAATFFSGFINTGNWGTRAKNYRVAAAEYNSLSRDFNELRVFMGGENYDKNLAAKRWAVLCRRRDDAERNGMRTFSWKNRLYPWAYNLL